MTSSLPVSRHALKHTDEKHLLCIRVLNNIIAGPQRGMGGLQVTQRKQDYFPVCFPSIPTCYPRVTNSKRRRHSATAESQAAVSAYLYNEHIVPIGFAAMKDIVLEETHSARIVLYIITELVFMCVL